MEYLRLPDLKSLAALRAVVELGGVAEAGRALSLGQPAITKRLRALEQCYDMPLMRRNGRHLVLTPAGEKAYAYAQLMLDHHERLQEDLQALRVGAKRLRLEVTFAIGEHLLPDLLLAFSDAHPEFQIESRMGYTRRIQTHLATGLTDLALLEQAPDHPDILVQKWLDDELMLVCGPSHPLWGREAIGIAALGEQRYVLREPKSSMRLVLDKALAQAGVTRLPIAMEVGSTDTIVEMLDRGRHLSFLPAFALRGALDQGALHHIRVEGLRIARTLWIARNRAALHSPSAQAFIGVLRASRHAPQAA